MLTSRSTLTLAAGLLFVSALAGPARAEDPPAEPKKQAIDEAEEGRRATLVVRKMLASLRLKKFDRALQYVGLEEMSRYLLDENYAKLTVPQQKRFATLIGEYIKKRGFPLAEKYIGSVGLSYDKPEFKDGRIQIRSSIVYSGSERLVFTWVLQQRDKDYVVVDFLDVQGKSSMQKSRDKQILPVFKKRGAAGLIKTLERVVAKL